MANQEQQARFQSMPPSLGLAAPSTAPPAANASFVSPKIKEVKILIQEANELPKVRETVELGTFKSIDHHNEAVSNTQDSRMTASAAPD